MTFSDNEVKGIRVEELFDVYVGLVSGKDEVYKVPIGNIEVLVDKDRVEKFIYTEKFPTDNEDINNHLLENKEELLQRKIKKFTEKNWYEWGAPRNIRTIQKNLNEPCIYVKNMTRQKEVAFIGKVQYFGGTLLCLIPKTKINLEEIVQYINTEIFQRDYMYAGRFKIGHKQLSNANLECL
jgi:adenine-specific DNA-methyltransferase